MEIQKQVISHLQLVKPRSAGRKHQGGVIAHGQQTKGFCVCIHVHVDNLLEIADKMSITWL
jgi:hypothetical protein